MQYVGLICCVTALSAGSAKKDALPPTVLLSTMSSCFTCMRVVSCRIDKLYVDCVFQTGLALENWCKESSTFSIVNLVAGDETMKPVDGFFMWLEHHFEFFSVLCHC